MNFNSTILLAFLFSTSCSSIDKPKKIRVLGEGKIRAMPNLVIFTIEVSNTQPTMVGAVSKTQKTVDSVLLILEKFSRKDFDIKTSSISANKDYDYVNNSQKFIGYQAQQSIDFTLNNISRFTEVTSKLLETGISGISNIQFGHSQADSLLREADLLAYDDALKSADKLTTRAGVKLGKALFISNDNQNSIDEDNNFKNAEKVVCDKETKVNGLKIAPEVLEFKRVITTEFEISQ